jgi:hypothetical protein
MSKRIQNKGPLPPAYLSYRLDEQGYVHHWLVAGPQANPVAELKLSATYAEKSRLAEAHDTPFSGVNQPPVQLQAFMAGDAEFTWQYWRCAEDHLLHLSRFDASPRYLRSWAYVQVISPAEQSDRSGPQVQAILTTHGPARLWVNGESVHAHTHFHALPHQDAFPVTLQQGVNEILCRFDQVAVGATPYRLALQFTGLVGNASDREIRLPTGTRHTSRFQAMEHLFEQAFLDRDIFSGDDEIVVHWPEKLPRHYPFLLRLQQEDAASDADESDAAASGSARIYAETMGTARPGDVTKTVAASTLTTGRYQAVLMPRLTEQSQAQIRIRRSLNLDVINGKPGQITDKSYTERLYEGVQQALRQRQPRGLLTEIAAMKLGAWRFLNREVIQEALTGIEREHAGSMRNVLALLGALESYGDQVGFPHDLTPSMDATLRRFSYGPGIEPWSEDQPNQIRPNQILAYTAQILAGQRFRARTFDRLGLTGSQLRRQGEVQALDWLYQRGRYGFRACFDQGQLDDTIFALTQLAALAESKLVIELASIVLDKLLFTLALNSHGGIGMGGLSGPAASVARLMWGGGVFNSHLWGVVGLADSGYEAPSIFADVALNPAQVEWSKERHTEPDSGWAMDRVTYRTPDFMLSSVQDYHPGQPGGRERIWQATLGAEAIVFVNHPAHCGPDTQDGPGFWQGDRTLPRVAQWKDTLVALYQLPEDDWLGFTHAYFPLYAFDEHRLHENWAFARCGDAYLAITAECDSDESHSAESDSASSPLTLINHGPGARRELRVSGHKVVWLCQMGRAAVDGSFAEFQAKILASERSLDPRALRYTAPSGEHLSFSWDGPLRVNGQPQPITGFKHYETPYCTVDFPVEEMNIQAESDSGGDYLLNLDFRREA